MITSEYLTPRAIASGLNRGYLIIIDDVLEKKCCCCGEYWICTKEFFHTDRGKWKSKCKACWHETRHISQVPLTTIKGRPRLNNE